ncbi:hypothetical protein A9Q84_16305 [Halobacteriovorax marinus]|uniref:Cytochrome c domain-containing protein n=1 Tax=Halobacteriovorax marinus TaxID=97084 RepID=A0A1Y5F495_9BACT|nr:hypothetical protein A9Q84_16305 [Halobacteriovorax marinus]
MKKISLLFLVLFLQSCINVGTDEASQLKIISLEAVEVVKFSFVKENIFKAKCLMCHAWAIDESSVLSRVEAGNPEGSLLYNRVFDDSMPFGGPPLTESEKEVIYRFIMDLK